MYQNKEILYQKESLWRRTSALNVSFSITSLTKEWIFKFNVIAVLLCGSETWRVIRADENKLDTFQHLCLKRILKIYWPESDINDESITFKER